MRAVVLGLSVNLWLAATAVSTSNASGPAAGVRLERIVVGGALDRASARTAIGRQRAAVSGCAARHLEVGRSKRLVVTLSLEGGRVSAVKVNGTESGLKRCLGKALTDRVILASGDGKVSVWLRLSRRSPTDRRWALHKALLRLPRFQQRADRLGSGSGSFSDSLHGRSRPVATPRGKQERRERERTAREQQRGRLLATALRVPRAPTRKQADWVRPELSSHDTSWFPTSRRAVATSREAAIVSVTLAFQPERAPTSRRSIYLAVHRTRGVLGEVAPPANPSLWSIDTHGVHMVTREGQLYHTPSLYMATRADAWTAGARIDGAAWDLAPGLIVAAKDRAVHVSVDGGKTFNRTAPPGGAKLAQVVGRHDGTIVVRTAEDGTFISPDRGRSWERSSFAPTHLWREGAWIYAKSACGRAILSADRRTWVQGAPSSRSPSGTGRRRGHRLVGWEALVDASERPLSFAPARHPTPFDPPPPALSRHRVTVTGEPRPCRQTGGGIAGIGHGGGAPGGCGRGAQGKGFLARCVRGTIGHKPRVSTLWAGWLTDGVTGSRPPSLVVVSHRGGKLSFSALPASCQRPRQIRSLRGVALLICEAADPRRSQIFVTDARGAWLGEGVLDAPAERLAWFIDAPDGTLLVQSCHYERELEQKEGSGYLCDRAFVREPVALGVAGAWRQLRATNALTYRPLDGGRALVVVRTGAGSGAIQLLVEGRRVARVLARSVPLDQDLQNLEVEQGRILVRLGAGRVEHVLSQALRFEALPRH